MRPSEEVKGMTLYVRTCRQGSSLRVPAVSDTLQL